MCHTLVGVDVGPTPFALPRWKQCVGERDEGDLVDGVRAEPATKNGSFGMASPDRGLDGAVAGKGEDVVEDVVRKQPSKGEVEGQEGGELLFRPPNVFQDDDLVQVLGFWVAHEARRHKNLAPNVLVSE